MEYQLNSGGDFEVVNSVYVSALSNIGLIASFEGGELDDAWSGRKDTVNGDLSTSSVRAVDGDLSLFHATGDGYDATLSNPGDGLGHYVGVPSKQRFYIYADDWSQLSNYWYFCRRNNGNDALYLRLWGSSTAAFFYERVGGSDQSIARDANVTLPSDQWLEVTITVNGPDGTTYSGLAALEPQVEIYTVNSDFSRATEVTTFAGDDGAGDPTTISESNAIAAGEGGYRWTFQGDSDVWVDYHHRVDGT